MQIPVKKSNSSISSLTYSIMYLAVGLFLFILFLVVVLIIVNCSKPNSNGMKSSTTEYTTEETERTITAYDYNGNKLGEWSGKINVNSDESFTIDGKHVIIHNAIIINEEQ